MPLSKELQIGKAGEHLVCYDLILKGFNAFLTDQGLPFDVLVETSKGLKRIQVKSTTKLTTTGKSFNVYRFSMRRARGQKVRFEIDEVDYFAFVSLSSKKIAYIPIQQMIGKKNNIKTLMELRDRDIEYKGRVYSNGTVRKRFGRFIDDYPFLMEKP